MHRRLPPKGLSTMERRVPKSEKYSHVSSRINSGLTVDKVKYVSSREYSKRREEIFFRITKHQLYELFMEYEQEGDEGFNDAYANASSGPHIVCHSSSAEPDYNKPYLLIDVRSLDSFESCHIMQARSFALTMMKRDQMHSDIYRFRNKPETLIILYCNDERISMDAAKLLVDRGIDNIYLLNGGLNDFAAMYPEYVEGVPLTPPDSKQSSRSAGGRSRSSGYGQRSGDRGGRGRRDDLGRIEENEEMSHSPNKLTPRKLHRHNVQYNESSPPRSGYGKNQYSSPGSKYAQSESGRSTKSNLSVAESIISRASSRKGRF